MTELTDRLKRFLSTKDHALYVGGSYTQSSGDEKVEVTNPADETILGTVTLANTVDVNSAVESAHQAFGVSAPWRKMTPDDRGKILYRFAELIEEHKDSIAQLVTLENGKLLRDAMSSDAGGAAKTLRYYAGWTTKLEGETLDISQLQKNDKSNFSFTRREPVGVVAAIVPWNFPVSIAIWKIAPALAAGCTVVLKPSEETPLSALMLAELGTEAGLPPGVFNVITGDGSTTGSALTSHPRVNKITFTGSTLTGKIIGKAAMDNVTGVSLELGGKSPAIVFDDVEDFGLTAKGVAAGIFRNQGQVCVAGSRAYIHEKVFDKVLADICHEAEKMKISHGFDPSADLGPLVSGSHLEKVRSYIQSGINEGSTLVSGGQREGSKGYYLQPTIFSAVDNDLTIIQEEIFGPVLVAVPFKDTEDAIQKANDSVMGLAATIWTSNISKAMTLVNRLEAGLIYVNSPVRSDPNLPLGGYKQSGIGRELGKTGIYNYTTLKSVNIVY
ncbi:MAG: aldehyde dehydrogenase family protein [Saprospiraceae bacterium]|nr:aldehyde dehydrogenase family protein [Saprospiraceae bacterium]